MSFGGELCESINGLARLLEKKSAALDDPAHVQHVGPLRRKLKRLMARAFRRQAKALLHSRRTGIVGASEADEEKPVAIAWLDSVSPLALTFTAAESVSFDSIVSSALEKGAAQLEQELAAGGALPETALSQYLESNSLSKLSGGFNETTKQALRDAITEAVQAGGTADDITAAIKDTMQGFSSVRADMIAQTEVNDAYNYGRIALARETSMEEKAWITESGNPCEICLSNEAEGWIPIDASFSSGDSAPTAHPRCACGLDFRTIAKGTKSRGA